MKTIEELFSKMGTDAGWGNLYEAAVELRLLREIIKKGQKTPLDKIYMNKEQRAIYSKIVETIPT